MVSLPVSMFVDEMIHASCTVADGDEEVFGLPNK